MSEKVVNAALLGLGTVGTGVYKVIKNQEQEMTAKLGCQVKITKILVRNLEKASKKVEDPSVLTTDWADIEGDPSIDIVIELIGGIEPARTYILAALKAGKNVVTANKDLIAVHGKEILETAKAAQKDFLFEAAVAGGIPIISPLKNSLEANHVTEVMGIVNGTTNFILTKMVKEGASFAEVLKLAQEKGYAEADPTADVEGIDAGRKICILADLAFGHQVDPAQVPMEGITGIDLKDVEIAGRHGYRIKLLGRCLRLEGGRRTAYVAPHLISEENPMSDVNDVFNAVVVRGNATGEVMFYGKGAGELPTASACVADVIECLQEERHRPEIGWSADTGGFASPLTLKNRWYFRVGTDTLPEALHGAKVLEQGTETAFITPPITGTDAEQLAAYLPTLAKMRVLD